MKRITAIAIATLALGSLGVSTEGAFAAKNDAYAHKKAECKQEAKGKHFGIHWAKRDRWIKNCIAGHRADAAPSAIGLDQELSARRHPRHWGWTHGRHLGWSHSHHRH